MAANTGTGVSAVDNGNASTWVGEDADVLEVGQGIRYRLYNYTFSADLDPCGTYGVRTTMGVTADGPDVGINDNLFFAMFDGEDGSAVATSASPSGVGASSTVGATMASSAAGLSGGVLILYGATTFQQPDISSGYTFGAPDVEVLEDLSACESTSPIEPHELDPGVDPPFGGGPTPSASPSSGQPSPISFAG
ncbi:MAG: hypothetical protein ACK4V6_09350 [Microthrixaceae bacterium]